MRAFVAIPLPVLHREALAVLQHELASSGADVAWVGPEQLHVTLKFLGAITELQRHALEARLRPIAAETAPCTLSLNEVGAFPSVASPRVVWVGIQEGRETLVRLAEAIEQAGEAIGVPREARPFAAHVTLGRVRSGTRRQALTERLRAVRWTPPPPWHATAMILYESVLSSAGSRYTILADIPLGPDG